MYKQGFRIKRSVGYGYLLYGGLLLGTANAQTFTIEKIDRNSRLDSATDSVSQFAGVNPGVTDSPLPNPGPYSAKGDRMYFVAVGDVLSRIAETETGSSANWHAIAQYNHLENPDQLAAGMMVLIPESLRKAELPAVSGVMHAEPSGNPASAPASGRTSHDVPTQKVDMFIGEIKILDRSPIRRIAVGNGNIVRAQVLDTNELLVIAEAQGSTSLRLWHTNNTQSDFNIRVSENDPETRFHLEKMVNMRVKMVEFRKSALRRLGIDWGDSVAGPAFATAGDLISNPLFRPASDGLGATLPDGVRPFSSYFGIASSLTSRLNLLASTGDAVLLAEPTLSCANGGSARFLAGGEVPYPSVGSNGQSSVDFKEYGIKLEVSPRIDNAGNVQTDVLAEISSIDPAVSVQGAPGLLTRRTRTQVNVRSGETIVIAGLLKSENSRDIDKLPGIANLPVLGKLFRSRNLRDGVSELVIFITPEVVVPDAITLSGRQKKIEVFSSSRLSQTARRLLGEVLE